MKIGLLSDTHNYLDPRIPELFAGVDHILHGGDIGLPWLMVELEKIAPVTAVIGNNDHVLAYKETEIIQLDGRTFLLHHVVHPAGTFNPINCRIRETNPDVVVFGHTHREYHEKIDGTLFVNPGYAGKPRFNWPRSVALLHTAPTDLRVEFLPL